MRAGASLEPVWAQERPGTSQEQLRSDQRRFRAKAVFGRGQGFPTSVCQPYALYPPQNLGSGGLEKKERYTSISYLESLPAAAAVTDPLVFVTLLGDGEILARGGRGSQQRGRGEPARERNPNLLVREKIWFAGDEGSQREQEPEAARGTRAQQKREVARRSPRGAQDEPRRSQKSNGSQGGA